MSNDETLFECTPARDPGRFDGLGKDARKTLRQAEFIEAGVHPATLLNLHEDASRIREGGGPRCGSCAHLWAKTGHFEGSFLKCTQTRTRPDVNATGPDMRAWWPACVSYQPSNSTETSTK